MSKRKTTRKRSRTSWPARAAHSFGKPRLNAAAPSHGSIPPAFPGKAFPIVGLGASAGGLEALEEFFKQMPPDGGMAFVVVTHQHPGHTSLLPELLRRCAAMPVVEASDNLRVKQNCIYVARPEGYLALVNGKLQFMDCPDSSAVRLPIDYFFRSLAEDQRERAVGVILSGTASDGTLGVKAIKGATGMTMAQEPESAKYPGMPRSAIATGLVDYVLPAGQLPQRLVAYAKGPYLMPSGADADADAALPEPMPKIIVLLRNRTGHDFSSYKPTTIRRRIERRMNLHQLRGPQQYLSVLQDNPHELDLLFKELLIGVTSFFRDPDAFEALGKTLKTMLEARPDDAAVRVWVPGCATGEEAYSLAILLREGAERMKKRVTVQIFGTDLNSAGIDAARTGVYPDGIAVDVSRERLARFFTKEDGHYRLKKEIREMVIFAPQNVCKDPPFTKLDLISCRNLLIYLNGALQRRLLSLFHYALKPDGLLFLGPSESIGELRDHFAVVDKKAKIFRGTGQASALQAPLDLSASAGETAPTHAGIAEAAVAAPQPRLSATFERLLLGRFAPASVIVNERGDISFIHGRTGSFLEPASGQPRHNLLEMAREGLRLALAAALRRAARQKSEVVSEGVRVKANGSFTLVDVAVSRITEPESIRGLFLVTFRPARVAIARPAKRKKSASAGLPPGRVDELEQELQFAKETLQNTVEELQTANEGLTSSNEELQSSNEELQSTNEELETSKEEMQSLNEELQTVNAQLQSKMEAFSQANDDMQNLLNSTAISTVFLDGQLHIRRFTEEARKVFNLIPTDVGRPIADLASHLNYDQLVVDATEVLRTLAARETEVPTREGGWRLVRILPYRTTENVIDGLVITLVDITRTKRAEQAAEQSRAYAESIVATVRGPLVVLDPDLRVVSANRAFYRQFKVSAEQTERRLIYEVGNGQWDIPKLRQLLEKILPKHSTFEEFEVEHDFPTVGRRVMLLNARRLEQPPTQRGRILLAMEDVTESRGQSRSVKKDLRK
jgi:two-component system, chemotaxis family, CheB/CheR fusion protein